MTLAFLVRAAAAAVVVAGLAGCTADGTGPAPARAATPTAPATVGEAYRDAELVAAREPGRQTAKGSGDSMAPVFGDNTLLVINPIRFEDLRPGMAVAYVNSRGQRVVHKLVSLTREGWLVIGFNNARIDGDVVTRTNLLGVVYASFSYEGEPAAGP